MAATVIQDDNLVEYGFRRVIITVTAVLCALLEIVDTTIVNVALNQMRGTLGGNTYRYCLGYNGLCYSKRDYYTYDKLVVTTVWTTKLLCRIYHSIYSSFFFMW